MPPVYQPFTSGRNGLVPASGGGTTNFLRADGTWAVPPGSGGSPGGSSGQLQWNNSNAFAGVNGSSVSAAGAVTLAPSARTSGSVSYFAVTAPADTTLAAGTESVGVNLNTSATRQFATGNITTQREVVIQAPTYAFVGASTITNAATLAITGAPIAGTNATITNPYALWVQSGYSYFGYPLTVTAFYNTGGIYNYIQFSAFGGTTGYIAPSSYDGNGIGIYDNYTQTRVHTIANLLQVQGSVGVRVGSGAPVSGQALHVDTSLSTNIGFVVQGVTSQSGDLQQWQNVGGSVLTSIPAGGGVNVNAAGQTLSIKGGSNACVGTGTLVGGTATVSTTAVQSTSVVIVTDTSNGLTNVGTLTVPASSVTAGTSFVVKSTNPLDTSTFSWLLINVL
jgi:hypothetical protein